MRLLATLQLDPARMRLISGFIDTYLRLSDVEEQEFQAEISRIEPLQREGVMEIVTSWMARGIEQGIEQGIERGIEQGAVQEARTLILRQLTRRFGDLPDSVRSPMTALSLSQLEALGEALLDFTKLSDLAAWLQELE